MLNQQTLNTLNQLKLFGMAKGFEDRLNNPAHTEISHQEFLGFLVQDEKLYRENKRLQRLLRNAKLKIPAAIEDVDTKTPRGLNKQVLLNLSNIQWVEAHGNVLLCGPAGVGKSFIACALGHLAARAGYTVLYFRAPRLFETLHQSRADGSHLKALAKLSRTQLLIIDDFLLTPLSEPERKDFLEIIEDRYGAGATVITSQCPLKEWHQNIQDPTIADAICDRLFHNASKIELKGDSFRKKQAKP